MPNHKKFKKPPLTKKQRENLSKAMKGNKNAVGAASGRPTDYNATIAKRIYKMLLSMVPVKRICEILEMSPDTYYRWIKEIPEFSDLVYRGTYGIDHEMVTSLGLRAKGFVKKVEKPIKIKDEKTGADKIINHRYKEYHPPDVRALEIWLRNRSQVKKDWSNLPPEDAPLIPQPTINVNQIDLSKLDDTTIKKLLSAIKSTEPKG